MTETIIEIKKLIAANGMVLTNGEAYGKEIYLGCNDSADRWREITEAEYQKILKEREEEHNENIYR